jgi:hypothetical protein
VFPPYRSPLLFTGERMVDVQNLANGTTRNLTLEQTTSLLNILDGKVKVKRKRYLKIGVLASLVFDTADNEWVDAATIADRSKRYINKNCTMTASIAGNLLGNFYRVGLVDRTPNPPHRYKSKVVLNE